MKAEKKGKAGAKAETAAEKAAGVGGTGAYGIKAYGSEHRFRTRKAFESYLMEWIAGTDGAERDRAVDALANLNSGVKFTDTDAGVDADGDGGERWYYVDISTNSSIRIAVKAVDEEDAKYIAMEAVDCGEIDPHDGGDYASSTDEFEASRMLDDLEPPAGMIRYVGLRRL